MKLALKLVLQTLVTQYRAFWSLGGRQRGREMGMGAGEVMGDRSVAQTHSATLQPAVSVNLEVLYGRKSLLSPLKGANWCSVWPGIDNGGSTGRWASAIFTVMYYRSVRMGQTICSWLAPVYMCSCLYVCYALKKISQSTWWGDLHPVYRPRGAFNKQLGDEAILSVIDVESCLYCLFVFPYFFLLWQYFALSPTYMWSTHH